MIASPGWKIDRAANAPVPPRAPAHTGDTVGKPKGSFWVTKSLPEAKKKMEGAVEGGGGGDRAHESRVGSHGVLALYGIV